MRFVCAAVAAVCVAGSASAAGLPDLKLGQFATVTYYGTGVVDDLWIENPEFTVPDVFVGALGKTFRIRARFSMFLVEYDGQIYLDQSPVAVDAERLDNGAGWGSWPSGGNFGSIDENGFAIVDDPSWWGHSASATYQFGPDTGTFELRVFYENRQDRSQVFWSEARGDWKITKMTVSVPEPATWAMFIAGFGLVGAAVRRKGRAVPAMLAA